MRRVAEGPFAGWTDPWGSPCWSEAAEQPLRASDTGTRKLPYALHPLCSRALTSRRPTSSLVVGASLSRPFRRPSRAARLSDLRAWKGRGAVGWPPKPPAERPRGTACPGQPALPSPAQPSPEETRPRPRPRPRRCVKRGCQRSLPARPPPPGLGSRRCSAGEPTPLRTICVPRSAEAGSGWKREGGRIGVEAPKSPVRREGEEGCGALRPSLSLSLSLSLEVQARAGQRGRPLPSERGEQNSPHGAGQWGRLWGSLGGRPT